MYRSHQFYLIGAFFRVPVAFSLELTSLKRISSFVFVYLLAIRVSVFPHAVRSFLRSRYITLDIYIQDPITLERLKASEIDFFCWFGFLKYQLLAVR